MKPLMRRASYLYAFVALILAGCVELGLPLPKKITITEYHEAVNKATELSSFRSGVPLYFSRKYRTKIPLSSHVGGTGFDWSRSVWYCNPELKGEDVAFGAGSVFEVVSVSKRSNGLYRIYIRFDGDVVDYEIFTMPGLVGYADSDWVEEVK